MTFDPRSAPVPPGLSVPIPGRIREVPGDFEVEEIPLYPPSGTGEHLMVLIEKRGLTTRAAISALARRFRVAERAIGCAGLKDRHAVTRQWLSLPGVDAEAARGMELPGLRILEAARHGNKLRTGHLRGNRFAITARGAPPDAAARAAPVLDRLAREGLPNGFGPQRFGARLDNHLLGEALVRDDATRFLALCGEGVPEVETPRVLEARAHLAAGRFEDALAAFPRDFVVERHLAAALRRSADPARAVATLPPRERDFLVSAWQSACFNEVLRARLPLPPLLAGDVAMKHANGACFLVEDLAAELPRLGRQEISATGPLPGRKLLRPSGEPGRLEADVLAACGWTPSPPDHADPNPFPGARRPSRVPVLDPTATTTPEGHLLLRFALPAGSYATALLALFGLHDVDAESIGADLPAMGGFQTPPLKNGITPPE